MLIWLSEKLLFIDPGFAVFQYLTLRGILAACTALAISMVVGPVVIERLNRLQIGQTIREEGPSIASRKGGHAHDGWGTNSRDGAGFHPVMG
jgi:phospho-N-acetylmuramoyl-pentapeptide-transferase